MHYLLHNFEVFLNQSQLTLYVAKNDLNMIKGQLFKTKYNQDTLFNSCVLVEYYVHASIQHPPAVSAK